MAQPNDAGSGPAHRGIAQTERLVLLAFGGLTAFTGFVVMLVPGLYPLLRWGVGAPVAVVGAGLCYLAVRPAETVDSADIMPYTLLVIERMALFPLAVVTTLGFVAMLIATHLALPVRAAVAFGSLLLSVLFWALIIYNRLPERMHWEQAPDRKLENTED